MYVFGSFARGAMEPNDVDLNVEYDHTDERWAQHFVTKLSRGEDPEAVLRKAVRGNRRLVQVQFGKRETTDYPMTPLWRRGESVETALERLHSIPADRSAGRADRHGMLPEFEGIDQWIPRAAERRRGRSGGTAHTVGAS
jgi:hypothetical protein